MVIYTEQLANIAAQRKQLTDAQQQAAAARRAIESQQSLRSGGLQAMQQRNIQLGGIKTYEGQIKAAEGVITSQEKQIQEQQKQYELETAREAEREARVRGALEYLKSEAQRSGSTGTIVYNSSIGDAMRVLKDEAGIDYKDSKQYYEAVVENSPGYQKAMSETGIRQYQQEITKSLPEGEKAVFGSSGKLVGVESSFFQQSLNPEAYNKAIEKYNKSLEVKSPEAKPLVVSAAPTLKQQYLSYIDGQPVKGTISFIAEKAKGLWTRSQIWGMRKGFSTPEQMDTSANVIGGATQLGIYSANPYLGAGLLIAGGTESYVTPQGREQLKQLQTSWSNSGVPNVLSYGAYAIPAAEIGLGFLGLKTEIKAAKTAREIKQFENVPLKVVGQRIEGEGKGIDFLIGYKKVGKSEYFIKAEQPYYLVGSNKMTMEGGRGVAYRLNKGDLTAVSFESGGRLTTLDTTPRLTKGIITRDLEGVDAGVGRVYTKATSKADLKLDKYYNPAREEFVLTAKGTAKPYNEYSASSFWGIGKQKDEFIDILSGKPTKAKYYFVEDKITITGKPDVIGRIKTSSTSEFFNAGASNDLVFKSKTTTKPLYAEEMLSSGLKTTLPSSPSSVAKTAPAFSFISTTRNVPKQEQITIEAKTQQQKRDFIPIVKTILSSGEIQKPKELILPRITAETITETRQKQDIISLQVPRTMTKQDTRQRSAVITKPQAISLTASKIGFGVPAPPLSLGNYRMKSLANKIINARAKGYDVLIGMKKRKKLGVSLTKEEALALGSKRVRRTLEAAFRIIPSGKEAVSKGYGVPDLTQFTTSKRDREWFVQRRGKRLSSREEVGEILSTKRKKERFKLF